MNDPRSGPLVVAYLYNTNGMASWCWEAAHALTEAGHEVVLVHSSTITLPQTGPGIRPICFDWRPPARTVLQKVALRLDENVGHVLKTTTPFLPRLHQFLATQGITNPAAYLLNQTDFHHTLVPVPQYVTAWAHPTTLNGYLEKTGKYTGGKLLSPSAWNAFFFSLGWWRRDWQAYRDATGILSVSNRITDELRQSGIKTVATVHPGTAIATNGNLPATARANGPVKMITVALELTDPRKRVRWLLEALRAVPDPRFTLTLVGNAPAEFQQWARTANYPVTFTGQRSRAEVQNLMGEHDIFLFGSQLDDWGYVLIEAMGQGLAVIAPGLTPFDEIVGKEGESDRAGWLYDPNQPEDLTQRITYWKPSDIAERRESAYHRAQTRFSRAAFARSLLAAVESVSE